MELSLAARRARLKEASQGDDVDTPPPVMPAGLAPWSSVGDMRAPLRQLSAPIWGTKDILWARLLDYERVATGESALRAQLARELAERREGQQEKVAEPLPQPAVPTEAEVQQHALTHVPFRAWCRYDVAGKARQVGHRSLLPQDRERGLPVVQLDYAIIRAIAADGEEAPRAWATCLAMVHVGTGMVLTAAAAHKGKSGSAPPSVPQPEPAEAYATKVVAAFINQLQLSDVVLQTDGEPAIKQLADAVRGERQRQGTGKTFVRQAPAHSSGGNGVVEATIGRVVGQVRTLRAAVEARYGRSPSGPGSVAVVGEARRVDTCSL